MPNEIYIVRRSWYYDDACGERFVGAFKTKEGAIKRVITYLNDINSLCCDIYPVPSDEWFNSHNEWRIVGDYDDSEYEQMEIVKYELEA